MESLFQGTGPKDVPHCAIDGVIAFDDFAVSNFLKQRTGLCFRNILRLSIRAVLLFDSSSTKFGITNFVIT